MVFVPTLVPYQLNVLEIIKYCEINVTIGVGDGSAANQKSDPDTDPGFW